MDFRMNIAIANAQAEESKRKRAQRLEQLDDMYDAAVAIGDIQKAQQYAEEAQEIIMQAGDWN